MLTPVLLDRIRDGQAILFLGAAATYGATKADGSAPLSAQELSDALADRFLGGALKERDLAEVAEYSKSESSLQDVQSFIAGQYSNLRPASFHAIIPTFRWHAIVTTNFDRIVEESYRLAEQPLQRPIPIVKNGDIDGVGLQDAAKVPLVKLHGCLNHLSDPQIPLILSTEEYARYRDHRDRVFDLFASWAATFPVIFCGYRINDPNIQHILFNLGDLAINRPTYAVVNKGLKDIDKRYWQSRRFVPESCTFETFLRHIDNEIPVADRALSSARKPIKHPILRKVVRGEPSADLLSYLGGEVDYVSDDMAVDNVLAEDFYRGFGESWGPVVQQLDVERAVVQDVLLEGVIERPTDELQTDLYLIHGHAGSGKSIALRRIAWDAAVHHAALTLWVRPEGSLNVSAVRQICTLCEERVFVFVDEALPRIDEIKEFLRLSRHDRLPVTVIMAARTNEWNTLPDDTPALVTNSFEMGPLQNREIRDLLKLLHKHACGGHLNELSEDDQFEYFRSTAERQLLVALHEATSGRPFEEIVVDEFNHVLPEEARQLYLDVCTFHRFHVPLRAGLVSRLSGISMESFSSRFFRPLERVVRIRYDPMSRDYAYHSRHPVIAELVFREVLADPEDRAAHFERIVQHMNVDFRSDRRAFQDIIRGRDLAELFHDRTLADRVFAASRKAAADVAHIEHQKAVFELRHPNGSPHVALLALSRAEAAAHHGTAAIRHTRATALRALANGASSAVQRDRYRAEAKEIVKRLVRRGRTSHPYHTLGELLVDELVDRLKELRGMEGDVRKDTAGIVRDVERLLSEALAKFPRDNHMLDLEARLAKVIEDHPRALEALRSAVQNNPADGFVVRRLARLYTQRREFEEARQVLQKCMDLEPTDRETSFQLAQVLRALGEDQHKDAIRNLYRRSFTPGDNNYLAQFWYARHEFLHGDLTRAEDTFDQLKAARMSIPEKRKVRGAVRGRDGKRVTYRGRVVNLFSNHCFVNSTSLPIDVFAHSGEFSHDDWRAVSYGRNVTFVLGFSMLGPTALQCGLE